MMKIAMPVYDDDDDDDDDDGDVDDETEVGSDLSFETSSETTCASSVHQDVDMDWIPDINIKQVCYVFLSNVNWVL